MLDAPARFTLALLLAAACGGPAARVDPGPDAPPACTPATRTSTVPVAAGEMTWNLADAWSPTAVLAYRKDSADAIHVALIDASATPARVAELIAIPDAAPYTFRAAATTRSDGVRCAIATSSKSGLFLGCEGSPQEAAGLDDIDADYRPIPLWQADGTLSVFGQSFEAFTELDRAPSGAWSSVEEYESSISYPTDAVLVGGSPVACFIDEAGRAVLARGDARFTSAQPAKVCHLALANDTLEVATDAGYATVATSALDAPGEGGSFSLAPVQGVDDALARVIVDGGATYALQLSPGSPGGYTLAAVPLPSGPAMSLATTASYQAVTTWDPGARAASLVSIEIGDDGSGGTVQTITAQTTCLP